MTLQLPINFKKWIDENRQLLKPPVGNQMVYDEGDFMIMVVGGPNSRRDYHVYPVEEFYQIEGDIVLRVIENNKRLDIKIQEGEIFLLPKNVSHSPQRFENTVGLVFEYKREKGAMDVFNWYYDECDNLLYGAELELKDIVKQLPPIFKSYWDNINLRTCSRCGSVQYPPLNKY